MTTADTLARFHAEYQVPQSITPKRQAEQMRELQRFAAWLDKPLLDLDQQDVLTYLGEKLTRGLTPNTVRTQYMMIRSFVTWGRTVDLIPEDRAGKIRLIASPRGSSARGTPNPYTPTEVRRFKEILAGKYPLLREYGKGSRLLPRYLDGRSAVLHKQLLGHARRLQYEAQVALALELGMRGKEIFELTIEAAHYENDAVIAATAKQGPGIERFRSIPWTTHAHAAMQEWVEFRELLRPGHDSLWLMLMRATEDVAARERRQLQVRPLSDEWFHRSLRVFGPGWRWHRFRHTAATEWLRAGMPLEKVQVLLGHARLEQTLDYTKIVKSDIAEAMENAQAQFAKRLGLAA